MKKITTCFLSIMLAILFAVFATGCMPPTILSFNKNFTGGKDPSEITGGAYTETLIYDVQNVDKYESISKSSTITSSTPIYNGTFISTFTNTKPEHVDLSGSDISNNADFSNSNVYYLKTVLDLNVTMEGVQKTFNDMIVSEACFYQSNLSYAPIWSKTSMKMTSFSLTTDNLNPKQEIYQFETIYNTSSYTLTKKNYQAEQDEDVNLVDISQPNWTSPKLKESSSISPKTYEYTLKSVIDNNQLFFILRNLEFSKQQSNDKTLFYAHLPTVSYAYGENKTLYVVIENEETYNLQHNLFTGQQLEEGQTSSMEVNEISFVLSSNEYTGSKKYVKIQKQKSAEYEFTALPVEYAEPLIDQNVTTYGALKYSLKQVSYN